MISIIPIFASTNESWQSEASVYRYIFEALTLLKFGTWLDIMERVDRAVLLRIRDTSLWNLFKVIVWFHFYTSLIGFGFYYIGWIEIKYYDAPDTWI